MRRARYLTPGVLATLLIAAAAAVYPDRGTAGEEFPGEGLATDDRCGRAGGGLPAPGR